MENLKWHRSDFGTYADSPTENIRYYVTREGSTWTLEVFRTIETAGVRTVKPGANAIEIHRFFESARITKTTAQKYEAEPMHDGAQGRMTRAIVKAYKAPTSS